MKRNKIVAAVLAVSLVIGANVAPAWAYFTDSHMADGGLPVSVSPSTDLNEWYAESVKHVVITNAREATSPVFVRAKIQTSLTYVAEGEGWSSTPDADGWYYYDGEVAPGSQTSEMLATFTFPTVKSDDEPDGAVYGDNYSAIVIYEATPAVYDTNGNPAPVWDYDWDANQEGGN